MVLWYKTAPVCWADDTGIKNQIHGFDLKSLEKCHSSRPWTQHGHFCNCENFHPHLNSTFVLSTFVHTFNIQVKASLPMKPCWNIEEWLWACAGGWHWTHPRVWLLYHTRDIIKGWGGNSSPSTAFGFLTENYMCFESKDRSESFSKA